ncbi:MAG TPA: DNA methyltransferase [Thermoanaerobaculia bacterium]|jgi:DNA modification methylase|nr:DNA methyltransferase [Thermoanaerobaculia bacterium]
MASNPHVTLINGDSRRVLDRIDDEYVDAVVTDPPYEIGFNNARWDSTGVAMSKDLWANVLRVTRPGAYLLAFGATRTFHRLTSAIEDAGFEIQDCLVWLYSNGFPKHRSRLKPAWEPIVLARKRAPNATVLNIEECRVNGRWPANVLFDEAAAELLDDLYPRRGEPISRMYYVAKPTSQERDLGLEGHGFKRRQINLLAGLRKPTRPRFNIHPTVKPITLMRHLVALVTPDEGRVLDPFTGSGTTGCAAVIEGRSFVGIEREHQSYRFAHARIEYWKEHRAA